MAHFHLWLKNLVSVRGGSCWAQLSACALWSPHSSSPNRDNWRKESRNNHSGLAGIINGGCPGPRGMYGHAAKFHSQWWSGFEAHDALYLRERIRQRSVRAVERQPLVEYRCDSQLELFLFLLPTPSKCLTLSYPLHRRNFCWPPKYITPKIVHKVFVFIFFSRY